MVQTAHVLIGGGTGFVGRHLVKCLKNSGAKVRVITRNTGTDPDHITWNKIKTDGLPKETTAVVNLAGRNILDPVLWTDNFKKELYDSRINTNRLLVDAIHKSPSKPKAFVTISGVGYYEPSDTVEYDENWTQPDDVKSKKGKYLMELAKDWELAGELDEQKAPSTRRVIIRSGVVIGNDGGIVKNSKLPYMFGLGGPLGNGEQWFPWIHADDLANMFKFSITNDHVIGIINGVAPELVRNKDFAAAFGNALNRPAFARVPSFAIKLVLGNDRAEILLEGQRVKSRSSLLGFRYQFSTLKEACAESVK